MSQHARSTYVVTDPIEIVQALVGLKDIEVLHLETPPTHEVNFRGVGEGGTIGAPAALTNAIADAIGIEVTESHLPPWRVLELLHGAG